MQPEKLKALLEEIGKAIQGVIRIWPEIECSSCGAMRSYKVTQLILERPYMGQEEGWRVNGIDWGPDNGWVRVTGGDAAKSYCSPCAKERIL